MILPVKGERKIWGGGRNWIILVFSLLLAFFMWSIMKLSASYSSYVRYRIEASTNIPGRSNTAVSTDVLVIGAKSTGFHIIQNLQGDQGNALMLDEIDGKHFHKYREDGDLFYLLPDNIRQKIQDALGADVKVESLATDTLFFEFPVQGNRKVAVVASSAIKYGKQFMPYSEIILKPDSVLIYGDEAVISNIHHVTTQAIKSNDTQHSLSGVVKLNPLKGVRFSQEEIFYSQEVGRFVEHTVNVPVTIGNAPSYANVAIVPQEVTIKYRQPFVGASAYSQQDFSVVVEYDEILRKDVVKPKIARMPEGILTIDMEPKFVECVL
jgi:hypothetical protein